MNKRNLQQWELRLGLLQLVILLGVVTGSMAGAFYIGFSSGRAVGFDSALDRSLANAARMPIASDGAAGHEENTSDVYAKLSQPALMDSESKDSAGKEIELPLGSIKTEMAALGDADLLKEGSETKSIHAANAETERASAKGSALGVNSVYRGSETSIAKNSKSADRSMADTISNDAPAKSKTLGSLLEADVDEAPAKKVEGAKSSITKNATSEVKTAPPVIEKQAAKIAPKEKSSSLVRDAIPAGWFAQISAPKKMSDATAIANKLKQSGFAVMIEVARVRGDEYYRVLVGPEQNRAQAERLVSQLKRESYIQGDPFLRVVK
jgi:cell division septation protein DedD